MATHHENKYTVHQRLTGVENRCAQLEAALPRLKLELLTELTQYADAHFHGRDGKDGVDGRPGSDCQCRAVKGDQGDPGDITILGDAELQAAVTKLRFEKLRWQAALLREIEENAQCKHSGVQKVLALVLKKLKSDAGL